MIASGREGGRGRSGENGAVKEMLDVRLRAPVVDNTMNRENTSQGWGKKRNGFGHGQTVIIVEDDRSRVYITKTHLYHQSTTTFPFPHPPLFGIPRQASELPSLSTSLWVTSPPFSKPFFKCLGTDPFRNKTKGHAE